ncbi:pleckstrin homology domain-containing family A member 8 isoform X1 [Arapaima gigas]
MSRDRRLVAPRKLRPRSNRSSGGSGGGGGCASLSDEVTLPAATNHGGNVVQVDQLHQRMLAQSRRWSGRNPGPPVVNKTRSRRKAGRRGRDPSVGGLTVAVSAGWQPRWFVLDGATLSYYDSQEDAWKGSKGSIEVSVCEIRVDPSDPTRVDLAVPGEQCFYLRSVTAAERQKWLVALGTAKACLTDNRTKRERGESTQLQENTEALKTKMSELRLYCDLLLQQVNKLKDDSQREAPDATPQDAGGEAAGALLKTTCSTFLKTLEECMQIAGRTFRADLLGQTPPGSPPVAAIRPLKLETFARFISADVFRQKELNSDSGELLTGERESQLEDPDRSGPTAPAGERSRAASALFLAGGVCPPEELPGDLGEATETHCRVEPGASAAEQWDGAAKDGRQEKTPVREQAVGDPGRSEDSEEEVEEAGGDPAKPEAHEEEAERVDTFFGTMGHRFSDIRLEDDNGIPTQAFLDSCYAIVPVLDKLGPTVFAPVKIDFVGNIKKIHQKFTLDPGSYSTLQAIVLRELEMQEAQVRNSATEALLWLKRGLWFLKEFLSEVNSGQKDVHAALNSAYGKTLRQYHGWVVRGVFALALRAAPSYAAFTAALVSREGDEQKEGFVHGVHRDLGVYLPAMERQLAILDALYEEYGLESDEVV